MPINPEKIKKMRLKLLDLSDEIRILQKNNPDANDLKAAERRIKDAQTYLDSFYFLHADSQAIGER
mgnify:CR=1 FL=1